MWVTLKVLNKQLTVINSYMDKLNQLCDVLKPEKNFQVFVVQMQTKQITVHL